MCNALEELRREGVLEGQREGRLEGRLEGIRATIGICKKFSISEEDITEILWKNFPYHRKKPLVM